MRFRTLALALALGCGFTLVSEARQTKPVNPRIHKVATRKTKVGRAAQVKPRKAKPGKVSHRRAKPIKTHAR